MKNPDYHLPLPPISQCQQKGIVTIQALYQAKSQDSNRFHDMGFLQDLRYNGNIMTFKKHIRLFPETRTCFFKKTYVFIFKSVSLPQEMEKEPSLSYQSLKPINTMGKFINPFTDFGFHRIFGQEVHKELLIDFLNQLFFGENRTSARTILNVGFIY